MKFIQKMRKRDKGFTLVEIIVVLVILAILAAFTIPTMLGFVNDAKAKAYVAQAREIYVAAQATATEYSATDQSFTADNLGSTDVAAKSSAASKQMATYLGDDITIGTGAKDSNTVKWEVEITGAKVDKVILTADGRTITLTAGGSTTIS